MNRSRLRQGVLVALTSILLGQTASSSALLGQTASSSAVKWQWPQPRSELLTSAHANQGDPVVSDTAVHVGSLRGRRSEAEAAALTSAGCPGCGGTAASLQVVYARALHKVTLDNVANAWAQCTDCRATAVSVQVVVARRAHAVTANNRALSVNAACTACHVKAVAFQLIVVDPEVARLSTDDITALQQWMRDQVAVPDGRARLRQGSETGSLERLVNDALGSSTFMVDAERG